MLPELASCRVELVEASKNFLNFYFLPFFLIVSAINVIPKQLELQLAFTVYSIVSFIPRYSVPFLTGTNPLTSPTQGG